MSLILSNEFRKLLTGLNLIETLNELVCESLNPLNVLILHLYQSVSYLTLPLCYDVDIWSILTNCPRCETFYVFELLKLLLITLVDVLEIFLGNETLQALILLFCPGVECCWRIMFLTINSKRAFRELLICVHKESIVDDFLV